jgi:hypothetical protein
VPAVRERDGRRDSGHPGDVVLDCHVIRVSSECHRQLGFSMATRVAPGDSGDEKERVMHTQLNRIRVVAAIGAVATTALVVSSSAHATAAPGPKPPPKCQSAGALVSLGTQGGLELYAWTVCGKRRGIPLG